VIEALYCASADWMERNLFRRVEVAFPILDPALHARVVREELALYLADAGTWLLQRYSGVVSGWQTGRRDRKTLTWRLQAP
jgi:polyphosphate kinase